MPFIVYYTMTVRGRTSWMDFRVTRVPSTTSAFASTLLGRSAAWVVVYTDWALDLLRLFRVNVVVKRGADGRFPCTGVTVGSLKKYLDEIFISFDQDSTTHRQ